MGQYNAMTVTDSGLAMLAKAQLAAGAITFTSIQTGNGTYEVTEEIKSMKALKSQKNSFAVSSVTWETDSKLKIRCLLKNTEVAIGYDISEIGVFGKLDTGTETLIGITTAVQPDFFPSADIAPSSILLEVYLEVSNCSDVSFEYTIPEGIYELAVDAAEKYNALEKKKVDIEDGKGLSANDYTTVEKNKLSGITSGAEVNQNAFSNVSIDTTTITAKGKTDKLTLAAGTNITLTPDAINNKITITAKDTTYNESSTSAAGLMSASDKVKLNGIATGANKTTVDSAMSASSTNPVQNKVVKTELDKKVNAVSGKGLSTHDYTTAEKEKLAGVEDGAQKNVVPTATTTDTTLPDSKAAALKLNTIRGKSEQKSFTGKQLLNASGLNEITDNGITYTPVYAKENDADGYPVGALKYINANGAATADSSYRVKDYNFVTLTKGETYSFNGCPQGGSLSTYYLMLQDTTYVQMYSSVGDADVKKEAAYEKYGIFIIVKSGTTVSNLKFKPMLRLASVTDSTYEPYVGGMSSPNPLYDQDIKSVGDSGNLTITAHGKNFYDNVNNNIAYSYSGIALIKNTDGLLTISGTATTDVNMIMSAFELSAGNYHYTPVSSGASGVGLCLYDRTHKKFISYGELKSFSLSENAKLDIRVQVVSGGTAKGTFKFQIEKGKSATDYEPYSETTFTIPLSEPLRVKDEIVKQDGIWGILRRRASMILKGTETWAIGGESNRIFIYREFANKLDKARTVIASHFLEFKGAWINMPVGRIQNYDNAVGIKIDGITTIDEFTTWLNENPVTIQYELAEPTFEPFPDEYQSLFYELESFDNVTYITTDSEVEPEIEIEYATSEAGAHMLNNYAKSNLADLTANKALPTNSATRSTIVTEDGVMVVDAVELNASVENTIANRVAKIESSMWRLNKYVTYENFLSGSSQYSVTASTAILTENCASYTEFYNVKMMGSITVVVNDASMTSIQFSISESDYTNDHVLIGTAIGTDGMTASVEISLGSNPYLKLTFEKAVGTAGEYEFNFIAEALY